MADYYIRQHDHGVEINDTLTDADGNHVDLQGATVTFTLAGEGASALTIDHAAATNGQNGDGSDGSAGSVSYTWQSADTATAGLFFGQWEVTFADGSLQSFPNDGYIQVLIGAALPNDIPAANARDLCTLDDVTQRTPGYNAGDDEEIDAVLSALIRQESRDFVEACGREIVAMSTGPRTFDLTNASIARRQLRIGDAATVTQVELFDYDDATSLGVIDPSLYVLLPRVRDDWEPLRRIAFPYRPRSSALMLAPGRTLHLTGTWGFPQIPDTVTFAVATFVIFRYLNDSASAGTQLAEAANRVDFNLAASLRAAMDVRDRLSGGGFA